MYVQGKYVRTNSHIHFNIYILCILYTDTHICIDYVIADTHICIDYVIADTHICIDYVIADTLICMYIYIYI